MADHRPNNTPAAHKINQRLLTGSVVRHLLIASGTSGLSLFALFLTDLLTLSYVAMLHDPIALAVVGLAKLLAFIISCVTSGIMLTTSAIVARRAGRGIKRSLPALASYSVLLTILTAVLIAITELVLLDQLSAWMGMRVLTDVTQAHHFTSLMVFSSVILCLGQLAAQLLRALGLNRAALDVALSGALILAVADPFFIFRLELGIEGAGIASLLSSCMSAGLGLYYVQRHIGFTRRVTMRHLFCYWRHLAGTAFPATLANLANPLAIGFIMFRLATHGTAVLAGMAVMDRVLQFTYCVFFALPNAIVPLLGQQIGGFQYRRMQQTIGLALLLVTAYGSVTWGILATLAPTLAQLLDLPPAGTELLLVGCRYGAGLWLLIGMDFVALSIFIAIDRPWWVALYAWIRVSLGTIPFVILGEWMQGASGALLGQWTGNALIALLAITTAWVAVRRHFLRHAPPLDLLP